VKYRNPSPAVWLTGIVVSLVVVVFVFTAKGISANADGYTPTSDQFNVENAFGGFVLDRISNPPRMKYDWSSEIFILRETPGPRGATYYKLDTGQNVLAETVSGSFILFTKLYPGGAPTTRVGSAGILERRPISASDAYAHIYRVEEKLNERLRRDIRFVLDWDQLSSDSSYRIAATDVSQIAGLALLELSEDEDLVRLIRRKIKEIHVVASEQPGVILGNGLLIVRFERSGDLQGRYSSHRTAIAIKQKL